MGISDLSELPSPAGGAGNVGKFATDGVGELVWRDWQVGTMQLATNDSAE